MPIDLPTSDDIRNIIREELDKALNALFSKPKEIDPMLSQLEVINRYQVTKATIIAWGKKGKLRPLKIGGKVFYKQSELP